MTEKVAFIEMLNYGGKSELNMFSRRLRNDHGAFPYSEKNTVHNAEIVMNILTNGRNSDII